MGFNQISYKNSHTKYFEKDLVTILIDYVKASGITILPLAVKVMIKYLTGETFRETMKMFFSNRDILIILVSIVSSAAFVTYKYLNRKPLCFICWACIALSFGAYLKIEYIDTFRGLMWFIVSIIFSFLNILASQYIPKERRKE